MNRVTITLTIDLPDGVVPDVGYSAGPTPEALPPWPEQTYDRDERVPPPAAPLEPLPPACPDHGPMKRYPAGTNKAGKPYNPSWRCATAQCPTKAIWDRDAA